MRSFAVGTESVPYSVMGKPHCRRRGTDLIYRVISTEQGKPAWLPSGSPQGEGASQDGPLAMRVTEMGESEGCPVIGQTEVASPCWDKITSPETELTSCWCSNSRTLEEPMHEAKQMTTGQPVGAASHTTGGFSIAARIGSKSVSSRSASF